jgi:hypothetical protein
LVPAARARALDQDGLVQPCGQKDHRRQLAVRDVLLTGEPLLYLFNAIEQKPSSNLAVLKREMGAGKSRSHLLRRIRA